MNVEKEKKSGVVAPVVAMMCNCGNHSFALAPVKGNAVATKFHVSKQSAAIDCSMYVAAPEAANWMHSIGRHCTLYRGLGDARVFPKDNRWLQTMELIFDYKFAVVEFSKVLYCYLTAGRFAYGGGGMVVAQLKMTSICST
jgi:hypothetical protein